MNNSIKFKVLGTVLVFAAGAAQASTPATGFDLSAMLAAVNYSEAIAAVLAIGALIAGKDIAIAGVKTVIRMIRGS